MKITLALLASLIVSTAFAHGDDGGGGGGGGSDSSEQFSWRTNNGVKKSTTSRTRKRIRNPSSFFCNLAASSARHANGACAQKKEEPSEG